MNGRIALFPGSFDPITLGHCDIVERALPLFDKITIGIGENPSKAYMFTLAQRLAWVRKAFEPQTQVEVTAYSGLTVAFAARIGARFILRGLRNPADFEFEKAIAHTNRKLSQRIEMVFLLTSSGKSYISSSIVRDVIRNGGDHKPFVPPAVKLAE